MKMLITCGRSANLTFLLQLILLCGVTWLKPASARYPRAPSDVRPAEKACREYEDYAKSLVVQFQPHILNGIKAEFGEFPHVGVIGYRSRSATTNLTFDCGATLIAPKFVLTAAHCVADLMHDPLVVRFNFTDFTNSEQEFIEIKINQSRTFVPKDYSISKDYHDIAVVELESEVPVSKYCRPVCLSTEQEPSENQFYYEAGWFSTNIRQRTRSNALSKAELKIQPLSKCNETYGNIGYPRRLSAGIIQNQLCAYAPNDDDVTCNYSGGALVEVVDEVYGLHRTIGVASSGYACGMGISNVYTRVSAYLDFIENIVWPQT